MTVADRATEWLAQRLAGGPVPEREIRQGANFAACVLGTARNRLGVVVMRRGWRVVWALPERCPERAQADGLVSA
jgi:hypothetical protein